MQTITENPDRHESARARPRLLVGAARRILTWAWYVLTALAILGAAALIFVTKILGMTPVSVVSGSMEPTLPVYSLIFVEEVSPARIQAGDIITFDPPGEVPRTTHRVVKRELRGSHWYFTTKGDANPAIDNWRAASGPDAVLDPAISYRGNLAVRHVFSVPWLGYLATVGRIPYLSALPMIVGGAVMCILVLVMIWTPVTRKLLPTGDNPQTAAMRGARLLYDAGVGQAAESHKHRKAG